MTPMRRDPPGYHITKVKFTGSGCRGYCVTCNWMGQNRIAAPDMASAWHRAHRDAQLHVNDEHRKERLK